MKVGLERNDLRVLRQRGVCMKFLVRLVGLHVDIDAVAQTQSRALVQRFVLFREELEGEFKMRFRFAAVGVNVACGQRQG